MKDIYIRFDEDGKQLDFTTSWEYQHMSRKNDWIVTQDFDYDSIDFGSKEFSLIDGVIGLVDKVEKPERFDPLFTVQDPEGRTVSLDLYFEGGGVNSHKVTGWCRRFNGMTLSNTTGMMFQHGAVIDFLEVTDKSNKSGKKVQILHFNSDGGDRVLTYEKEMTGEFLYDHNLGIYIPPLRRFAVYLTGNTFSYPQYRIGYRRIFE